MSQCVVVRKEDVDGTLAQKPVAGKHLLEPLKSFSATNALPLNILEDCGVKSNDAEVHEYEGDLWLCLEGEARFVVDGELVNPKSRMKSDNSPVPGERYAQAILGGSEVILKPGDWLWVPPGQPHQHFAEGIARLMIIKIPVKAG